MVINVGAFIKRITRCEGCRAYPRSTSWNFSKL